MIAPHYIDQSVTLYHGDCLDVLAELPDASADAVVTDPPYLLGFMGREWDTRAAHEHLDWHLAWCQQALRVLKPGAHLLAFGGTRTWHRLACAVEDAGFEIRDSIAWLYGAGFPKSLDVSKAIDKAVGAEREVVGHVDPSVGGGRSWSRDGWARPWMEEPGARERTRQITAPATDEARQWQGWGTALKPAHEPIVVARKPLTGTVAANVLQHGTGALNIDGCRLETTDNLNGGAYSGTNRQRDEYASTDTAEGSVPLSRLNRGVGKYEQPAGRWPANVVLDEHQAGALDGQSGQLHSGANPTRRGSDKFRDAYGDFKGQEECVAHRDADSGGASRFFYTAKASSDERPRVNGTAHPTVKPLSLMRWLVRLVTPPGGLVVDPFAGSGTTAEACIHEHKRCIAIEREDSYLPLIAARLTKPIQTGFDLDGAAS